MHFLIVVLPKIQKLWKNMTMHLDLQCDMAYLARLKKQL